VVPAVRRGGRRRVYLDWSPFTERNRWAWTFAPVALRCRRGCRQRSGIHPCLSMCLPDWRLEVAGRSVACRVAVRRRSPEVVAEGDWWRDRHGLGRRIDRRWM